MKETTMPSRATEPDRVKWGKRRMSRRMAYVLSTLLGVMLIFGAAIAVLLLTQTVPVVTSAAILSTTCIDGANPLTANVSFYIQGVTSYIRFTCTTDSHGYQTKGSIQSTPTFTLPSPFTQLWSFETSSATGTTCAAGTGAWQMTSGSPHTFPSGTTNWDYCAVIPNTATADSTLFTVAWSA